MSTPEIMLELLIQLALLVTCTFLFGLFKPHLRLRNGRVRDLMQGGLFGLFALVIMLKPIIIADGIIFDLRNVIIAVVAALVGRVPGLVICLVVIVYRLSLGGAGAPVAAGAAVTSLILGSLLAFYRKRHAGHTDALLIGLGGTLALQSLVWLLLLPAETARPVIAAIAFPLLLVAPASSWLFGALLRTQARHLELEAALSAERNLLRTLIDHIPDYIFIKDQTKRYLLSNVAHAQAAGVAAPANLLERQADAFFPAEYVAQHDLDDEAVLKGDLIIAQERQTVNADGTVIWVSTTKVPVRDPHGAITGIVGISHNIMARKQLEEALQHERTLLRTLIDAVPANVYVKDRQSRFVEANRETALQMGVKTPNDLIGKTDFDFFSEAFAAKYFADEQAVIQTGQPLLNIEEINFDQRTQQQSWFLTSKVPIVNEQGEVTGLAGVGLDIRARKQAEEALQEQRDLQAAQARANDDMRRFLQSTLDAFPAMTVVLDRDGSILLVNQPWTQFADENGGQSSSYYLGSNYLAVCDTSVGPRSDEAERAAVGIRAVIDGQQASFYLEYPCPSPTEPRWFGLRVSPFAEAPPRRVVVAHINILILSFS